MTTVTIKPIPANVRCVPRRLRHRYPPIFDGPPTPADVELARELYRALDAESQDWYGSSAMFADLRPSSTPTPKSKAGRRRA